MNIILSQHGFNPCDIRVIRKGDNRTFGFIDFGSIEEATAYMKYTSGLLRFEDGFETRIEFARENDPHYVTDKKTQGSSDWLCAKVTIFIPII